MQVAAAEGVQLTLSAAGKLNVSGPAIVVTRWLPVLQAHKSGILAALAVSASNGERGDGAGGCDVCRHRRRPGLADPGYCSSGRPDLALAYGRDHPLRRLPEDGGAECGRFEDWS